MHLRRMIWGSAIVLGAGCGDSQDPEVFGASHLQFTYSGTASGTYDATGEVPSINESITEWAYGQRVLSGNTLRIISQQPAGAGKHDVVNFNIERLTEGSATFNVCGPGLCTLFSFTPGVPDIAGGSTTSCYLTAGTATITEIGPTRARGTFSGTGTCSDGGASETAFAVTNGSFDVQLLADLP